MQILGLEKLSLVDYDGCVSATLFTGGCNFLCPFCHNATLVTDYKDLPEFSEEEIFDYLNKRKSILEGVVITGGEPTLHHDLPLLIEKIKKIGYKVKLDTNGTNPKMVKSLYENGLIDFFAMDIKNDKINYGKIIGIDNYDTKNVEESVDFFLTGKADYEFRTTLIKEFHREENIIKIGEWIKGAKKYRLQKFKNGDNCLTQNLNEVDIDTAKKYVKILEKNLDNVALRGYE